MKHGSSPEKNDEILKKFRRKHVRKHPSGTIPGIHEKIDVVQGFQTALGSVEYFMPRAHKCVRTDDQYP